jgi:hypothetical protein
MYLPQDLFYSQSRHQFRQVVATIFGGRHSDLVDDLRKTHQAELFTCPRVREYPFFWAFTDAAVVVKAEHFPPFLLKPCLMGFGKV